MKEFVFISLLLISLSLSGQNKYHIKGTIDKEYNGRDIMLFKFCGDSIVSVDTTRIEDAKFYFSGLEDLSNISLITTGNYPNKVLHSDIILEKGEIKVHLQPISKVEGTILNNIYQEYSDSISAKNERGQQEMDRVDPDNEKIKAMFIDRMEYRRNFQLANMSNIVGQTTYIRDITEEYDPLFLEIYETLPEKVKSNPNVLKYVAFRQKSNENVAKASLLIDTKYTDYELRSPLNEKKKISDFVGQSEYLFIDFWASWCGPCIADLPKLKEVQEKYKDSGLEILSISIDENIKPWLAAIKKHNIAWTNLVDLSGGEKMKGLYACLGIPCGVLLDKNGTIIANMLHAESLNQKMDELLQSK